MFRYLKLKNFQSLVNLEVDFMKTQNDPKRLIAVYGENGAGKTNFSDAFLVLTETLLTRKLTSLPKDLNDPFILDLLKYNNKNMISIIENYKTVNSKGNMSLEYGFKINGKNGTYYLEMDNEVLVHEKLDFVLNKKIVNYFDISKKDIYINSEIFTDKKYLAEVKEEIKKYWSKNTLLAIVLFDRDDRNKKYVDNRIHINLKKLLNYFLNICVYVRDTKNFRQAFFEIGELTKGTIKLKNEKKLDCFEEMLNIFYTSLYPDIKKVYYKKEIKDDELTYRLYFKKLIFDELKDIPFDMESHGTKRLINILPYFINVVRGNVSVIDEIDTACHDVLINKILNNMKHNLKGQLIITTHNTLLLEKTLDSKEAYVFYIDQEASKKLISIDQFEKVQPNLNMRKRYIEGLYGGVPYLMDVDFLELNEVLNYEEN